MDERPGRAEQGQDRHTTLSTIPSGESGCMLSILLKETGRSPQNAVVVLILVLVLEPGPGWSFFFLIILLRVRLCRFWFLDGFLAEAIPHTCVVGSSKTYALFSYRRNVRGIHTQRGHMKRWPQWRQLCEKRMWACLLSMWAYTSSGQITVQMGPTYWGVST